MCATYFFFRGVCVTHIIGAVGWLRPHTRARSDDALPLTIIFISIVHVWAPARRLPPCVGDGPRPDKMILILSRPAGPLISYLLCYPRAAFLLPSLIFLQLPCLAPRATSCGHCPS